MKKRERQLPPPWYPDDPGEISRFLEGFPRGQAVAAISPHAGWYYSGKIAARAVSSLKEDVQTVVVIGGHVPRAYPILFAPEDTVSTPFGDMEIDDELRRALIRETDEPLVRGAEDRYSDNTVEVLLPMVRFFIPGARLLWLRFPAEISSCNTGKILAAAAGKLGRSIAVLASADLTHYGPNYGFTPKGTGPEALQWVREINDRRFIEAVEAGDPAAVLLRAEKEHSSCSAGSVLGAMGFSAAMNSGPARLLEYGTSTDVSDDISDSFVGYAAIKFEG